MSAVHVYRRANFVSVALLAASILAAACLPVFAEDATHARTESAARRSASLGVGTVGSNGAAARAPAGFSNGFVYTPGPQPVVGIRGRLNVGKSGVYVPYYGNLGNDPLHANVQGAAGAGIGYGFGSWDVSVVNGSPTANAPVPGDPPKANPSLQFSIRF